MCAAAVGHRSGRATPSLRDAPQQQSMEIVGRETIYRNRNAVQTNPATSVLTSKLFNAETYEAFGFFAFFDAEKRDLINRFQQHDIDLSGSFQRWIAKGNFLYSYNHPRIDVLIEVLRRALVAADILPSTELERPDADLRIVDNLREAVH